MSTGAHVLVVDDDEDILKLLTMRLRAKGFRITAVGSAEQALAQIAIDPPRVVVSDIRLVRMGWRCLKRFGGHGRPCPLSCSPPTVTSRTLSTLLPAVFSAI